MTGEPEPARAAEVQDALYRIAELASAAQDMQEFYRAIHGVVGELMYANNFFIPTTSTRSTPALLIRTGGRHSARATRAAQPHTC
jgi:hypothetical protein